MALFAPYLPANTVLSIELSESRCSYPVIMRLQYTSSKSGKTMTIVAKGESLPFADDSLLRYYVKQLVLDPMEVGRYFAGIYYRERRARQMAFLQEDSSIRVGGDQRDRMDYENSVNEKVYL